IRAQAQKQAELSIREAQVNAERLTHSALQRSAEIEKAIQELKLHRANFRLQLQKMIELFQQVLDFDRDEDDKERPLSYLTRKADTGETAGSAGPRSKSATRPAWRHRSERRRAGGANRARFSGSAAELRCAQRTASSRSPAPKPITGALSLRVPPTCRWTPPEKPSSRDSWTPTRTRSGRATGPTTSPATSPPSP